MYIFILILFERQRSRKRQRSPLHWFTLQRHVTAMVVRRSKLPPTPKAVSPTGKAGSCRCEPPSPAPWKTRKEREVTQIRHFDIGREPLNCSPSVHPTIFVKNRFGSFKVYLFYTFCLFMVCLISSFCSFFFSFFYYCDWKEY